MAFLLTLSDLQGAFLLEMLERLHDDMGNAGCNDHQIEVTHANANQVRNFLHLAHPEQESDQPGWAVRQVNEGLTRGYLMANDMALLDVVLQRVSNAQMTHDDATEGEGHDA